MGTLKGRKRAMPGAVGSPHHPGAGRKGQMAPPGVPVVFSPEVPPAYGLPHPGEMKTGALSPLGL